jgi:hypothetical protein
MRTLTCASQHQLKQDLVAKAALLKIVVQLYVEGGTRQHRSILEGTSSCRARCRSHTCCSPKKEVPSLRRTTLMSPATCRNKMLDAIINHFKPPCQIICAYTRGHEPV